jgi:hypothetical protein
MTPEEFDEFYADSAQRLIGQLYGMIGDLAEAQDVVQDAFIRAWDRHSQLDSSDNPEAKNFSGSGAHPDAPPDQPTGPSPAPAPDSAPGPGQASDGSRGAGRGGSGCRG